MTYEEIDRVLIPWLKKYGLHVFTQHLDYQVRAFYIVDDVGSTYEVSLLPFKGTDEIEIRYGCYKTKKTKTIISNLSALHSSLEEIYGEVMQWIKETGNSRTPV